MDTISIIIPTYNRPADLNRCLVSILNQTVPPLEVMVIDDGNLADPPLMDAVLRRGIEYLYHKKEASERGLTKSRNWGVKKAKGDIILFLDDDVELLPDYIEILLKVYKNYPEVAGAGGYNQKSKPLKKIWLLYDIAFCLAGFKEGYFLPSGFSTNLNIFTKSRTLSFVQFLGGASFSFRREVFKEFLFDESFTGYGLGEDKDFSHTVSKKYPLVAVANAKLLHHESPVMRYQLYKRGREKILSKRNFFLKHKNKSELAKLMFCYAVTGYFLKRFLIMLVSYDRGEVNRVLGILGGICSILKNRRNR